MGRRRRSLLESRGSVGGSPRLEDVWTADQTADLEAALSGGAPGGVHNGTTKLDDEPSDIEVPIAALSPAPLRLSQASTYKPPPRDASVSGSTAYPAPVPAGIGSENLLRGALANDSSEPLSVDDALRRDARIPSPAPNLESSPSVTAAERTVRSMDGYERPRAQAIDAPVASELFGDAPGYDDFEVAPPTDEFPARVLEDVGQPYLTPYSVPEPPPIPGILDRFTPPPTYRTDLGSRRKKPEYSAETPQLKGRYEPTPSPERRVIAPKPIERREEPPGMSPLALMIGIVSVLFVVGALTAIFIALMVFFSSQGNEETDLLNRAPVTGGVEMREGTEATDRGTPPSNELEVPERPLQPIGDPTIAIPVPALPKLPITGPAPAPEPPPIAPPPPQPPPKAIDKGTLKIRSNRRVLVYVDGDAIGYTPREVSKPPGSYNILVMMPGQPNTKQARQATIDDAHPTVIVDFSF